MTLPKCDQCGKFTSHPVEEYVKYQPDPWNGPRTTLLCERCAAVDNPATPTVN